MKNSDSQTVTDVHNKSVNLVRGDSRKPSQKEIPNSSFKIIKKILKDTEIIPPLEAFQAEKK